MRRFAFSCSRSLALSSSSIKASAVVSSQGQTRLNSSRATATTTGIILGNTERGIRTSSLSNTTMSDIASSNHLQNRASTGQIPAGDLLGVMDVCAGNVAQMHCTGSRRFGRDAEGNQATSVCTVAVDQTPFAKPVLNGDMVVVEGRAIHAGSSSVGVAVEVYRLQFPTRRRTQVCHSFFTMVAIDDKLKKASVVPALELSTPRDVALNKQYLQGLALAKMPPQTRLQEVIRRYESQLTDACAASERAVSELSGACAHKCGGGSHSLPLPRQTAKLLSEAKSFDINDIECAPNKLKRSRIPFEETRTEANRVFFPQHLNMNYTIFGGELMRWMEAHALHCGRMFSANRDVRTLEMFNVMFNDAIIVQDWVSLNCHVVYVHQTTMEVEVEICVEREGKEKTVTNRASFILANFDEAGQLFDIPNGLELKGASHEWIARYADARARYEIGRLSRNFVENAFSLPKE